MRIGLTIPNNWGVEPPEEVIGQAVAAEELGFHSVWVMEHVLNAGYVFERIGMRPYYDALTCATWAAARTSRIRIGTSILVLPYHNPVVLAKQLATLDQLSQGRLIVGIGAGWARAEFKALRVNWVDRWDLTAEGVSILRGLWTGRPFSYEGAHWRLSDARVTPSPAQNPLPVLIGGSSGRAIDTAAIAGTGWHPIASSAPPTAYAAAQAKIRRLARAAGRQDGEPLWSLRLELNIPRPSRMKSPSYWHELRARLNEYAALNVELVVIAPLTGDLSRVNEWSLRCADNLIGRV